MYWYIISIVVWPVGIGQTGTPETVVLINIYYFDWCHCSTDILICQTLICQTYMVYMKIMPQKRYNLGGWGDGSAVKVLAILVWKL